MFIIIILVIIIIIIVIIIIFVIIVIIILLLLLLSLSLLCFKGHFCKTGNAVCSFMRNKLQRENSDVFNFLLTFLCSFWHANTLGYFLFQLVPSNICPVSHVTSKPDSCNSKLVGILNSMSILRCSVMTISHDIFFTVPLNRRGIYCKTTAFK